MAATIDNFLNSFTTKFEAPVRSHLKNVYATLTLAVMAAATGAYVHMFTDLLQGGGILLSRVGLAWLLDCTALRTRARTGRTDWAC